MNLRFAWNCGLESLVLRAGISPLEQGSREGETPVILATRTSVTESSCLGLQLKVGGKFHLKPNISGRPIAYKYREGKMQRTLKRELKST